MDRESLEIWLGQGLSLEQIGRKVGRHPSTVGYWARRFGLQAVHSERHAPRGPVPRAPLQALVDRGLSGRAIAAELGVSLATVRYWLRRHGLRTMRAVELSARDSSREAPRGTALRRCHRHGEAEYRWLGGRYRCARCNSEAVARRRREIKEILVREAGGGCVLCGYERYAGALQFHHLDPATKRFHLGHNGMTRAIATSRAEAEKCVLLCANCHAEVEGGVAELPIS